MTEEVFYRVSFWHCQRFVKEICVFARDKTQARLKAELQVNIAMTLNAFDYTHVTVATIEGK